MSRYQRPGAKESVWADLLTPQIWHIIEKLGGQVGVESGVEGGSLFYLTPPQVGND
jgi:hypothetical protein